jgi:hypothetical protein
VSDLLDARRRVEAPGAAILDDRDRHRPVVRADDELDRVRALGIESRARVRGSEESLAALVVEGRISRADDRLCLRAEDGEEPRLVVRAACREERVDGRPRRREALLAAPPARAVSKTKQVDQITCEEFLALDPADQQRIAYWVDGYQSAKGEAAVGTVAFDKF